MNKAPILITGCARSGTSIIARALAYSGVFSGGFNARSSFSNINIQQNIIKPYMRLILADERGQYPLPDTGVVPITFKKNIINSLQSQGYQQGAWLYKDNLSSLLWKVWNQSFPDSKWIIVRRRTGDVIQACLKTGYMNAFSDPKIRKAVGAETEEEGWKWWVNQYEKRFVEMIEADLNIRIIWPERMVDGEYDQLYDVIKWCGVDKIKGVAEFVEPLLWKSRNLKERSK